jgi:hypothetical protein
MYEDIHDITICPAYRAVLARMKGAMLFEVSLFGLPKTMAEKPPRLDRSTVWPFDLATAQKHWSLPLRPSAHRLAGNQDLTRADLAVCSPGRCGAQVRFAASRRIPRNR